MGPTGLQQIGQALSGNSTTAGSGAFGTNVVKGNLIVVAVATYNSGITVTITDSRGNTYSQAGSYAVQSTNVRQSIFYTVSGSSGACTITVTKSATCYMSWGAAEYSGVQLISPLDSTQTNTGNSASPSTGTCTVSGTNDLVIVAANSDVGGFSFSYSTLGLATRYTVAGVGGVNEAFIMFDGVASSNFALTFAVGFSSNWAVVTASFKAAVIQPVTTPAMEGCPQ